MEHFYKNIENWFDYDDLYREAVNNAKDGALFVEIGVWKGGSTAYIGVEIVNSNKKIRLDAIDTFGGSKEHDGMDLSGLYEAAKSNLKPLIDLGVVNLIKDSSLHAASRYSDKSIDFCFIDGSHEYNDVKKDILAYLPKMKDGAILAGHDYSDWWGGVIKAVDEVLGKGNIRVSRASWIYRVRRDANKVKSISDLRNKRKK